MSVFAPDLCVPSSKGLEILFNNSTPRIHLPLGWKFTKRNALENLEDLMAHFSGKLSKYESPEKLLQLLMHYNSFPGCSSFYNFPKTDPYFGNVQVCKSLSKKDNYIYKKDFFPILQAAIFEIPLERWEAELSMAMLFHYLKTQEAKMDGAEMVKVVSLKFVEVEERMAECNQKYMNRNRDWEESMVTSFEVDNAKYWKEGGEFDCLNKFNVEKMANLFIYAMKAEAEVKLEIVDYLEEFCDEYPVNEHFISYYRVFLWISMIVSSFQEFIDENIKFNKDSILVRMFPIGNDKCVIAHELLHRMKNGGMDTGFGFVDSNLKISGFEEKIERMEPLATLTFRQIFDLVPKEALKKISFVVVAVRNDATPIPVVGGGYCLLKNERFVPFQTSSNIVTETLEVEKITIEPEVKRDVKEQVAETLDIKIMEKPRKEKNVRAPKAKTTFQAELPEPKEKESKACEKCYRASLHTRQSNEKLRLEKIETKALKKKVMELEVENMKKEEKMSQMDAENKEKDEKIRMLERQLDIKTRMVENLEAKISPPEVVTEASPNRSQEETEKVRDVLFGLLNIRAILQREAPISTVLTMTNRMMYKTNNTEIRRRSRIETISYREACFKYIESVESSLAMIRANQQITADQIPELPVFPILSQWFQDAYKETMKLDAPKLCESLIKTPVVDEIADKECLICLEQMNVECDTTKCECCRRRYHGECIKEWFKTKRMCPTCYSGLLDNHEFPSLS